MTVHAANIVLKGVLRVTLKAGFELSSENPLLKGLSKVGNAVFDKEKFSVGAGMEVGVFAHVAEFLTNVTAGDVLEAEDACALRVIEEYTLALGAYAGATLNFMTRTYSLNLPPSTPR